jgi:sodium-dependent phosphate transporter
MGQWEEFRWLVIIGGIGSFIACMGIGANDVSNSFATSVGSKALTLTQAMLIASIFEFLGAVLLGGGVTKTVATGVVDLNCFTTAPDVFLYGMSCVMWATGFWLLVASYLELPVSTTHSTIGGLVGFALTYGGSDCVQWFEGKDSFPYGEGVVMIFISWVVSPVLAALLAIGLFMAVRHFVLRRADAFNRAMRLFPALVFGTIFINVFFVAYKGLKRNVELSHAIAWASGLGAAGGLIAYAFLPRMRRRIEARFALADSAKDYILRQGRCIPGAPGPGDYNDIANAHPAVLTVITSNDSVNCGPLNNLGSNAKAALKSTNVGKFVASQLNRDLEKEAQDSTLVQNIHAQAEVFEPKAESFFSIVQVFTAVADSFAHGSNDVANGIGPFAALYLVYQNGTVESLTTEDVSVSWILAMGAAGIVVGLLLFGYILMRALGFKVAKITPARGFIIELSSAVVVLVGSRFDIPLSTTHCQVGAIFGMGICEGQNGVNWLALTKILIGWGITMVVCGFTAALLFAQGVYSPSAFCEPPP